MAGQGIVLMAGDNRHDVAWLYLYAGRRDRAPTLWRATATDQYTEPFIREIFRIDRDVEKSLSSAKKAGSCHCGLRYVNFPGQTQARCGKGDQGRSACLAPFTIRRSLEFGGGHWCWRRAPVGRSAFGKSRRRRHHEQAETEHQFLHCAHDLDEASPQGILSEGESESKSPRPAFAPCGHGVVERPQAWVDARMWKSPPMRGRGLLITPQGRYGWGETGITA